MSDRLARREEPWDARAGLHAVDLAVADAENDLALVLSQPMLVDPGHPSTARFASERARVGRLVRADDDTWAAREGVANLEDAWRSLREEARRAGLSGRPFRERRRVHRARRLLEQARSDRGSPAMRVRAFHRGVDLLDGLITLPERLRRDIYETAARTGPLRIPGPDFQLF